MPVPTSVEHLIDVLCCAPVNEKWCLCLTTRRRLDSAGSATTPTERLNSKRARRERSGSSPAWKKCSSSKKPASRMKDARHMVGARTMASTRTNRTDVGTAVGGRTQPGFASRPGRLPLLLASCASYLVQLMETMLSQSPTQLKALLPRHSAKGMPHRALTPMTLSSLASGVPSIRSQPGVAR